MSGRTSSASARTVTAPDRVSSAALRVAAERKLDCQGFALNGIDMTGGQLLERKGDVERIEAWADKLLGKPRQEDGTN